MKVLLDENLPHELRHEVVGHDVYTVQFMGWCGLRNGAPLAQAGVQRRGDDAQWPSWILGQGGYG
jgi:hypothetical protein